jgi:hypothetical protein
LIWHWRAYFWIYQSRYPAFCSNAEGLLPLAVSGGGADWKTRLSAEKSEFLTDATCPTFTPELFGFDGFEECFDPRIILTITFLSGSK